MITEGYTAAGPWDIYYQDMAIVSADGTVRPLYSHETSVSLNVEGSSGSTRSYEINHCCDGMGGPDTTTEYYSGDQIGSERLMTNYNGYPVWSGTFTPFGTELNAETTVNHYKFTGKERDAESNLDNFGARYYAAGYGRFMSPDPGPKILENPEDFNAYSYGLNNPLRYADDGGRTPQDRVKAANHFASMDIPYLWGGKNPLCGLDCSGLVQNVFKADPNNTIPALDAVLNAASQAAELQEYGQYSTNIKDAQLGDAIFFASAGDRHIVHTGIVVDIRDGRIYFVDAPNHTRPVGKDWIWAKGIRAGLWGNESFAGVGRPIEGPHPRATIMLPQMQTDPYSWVTLSQWAQELFDLMDQPVGIVTHTFCGASGQPACMP